jgi:hypothetical protein
MYPPYKLNGAVDTVRGAWAEARGRAIAEGRAYRFSVEPQGTHFRVAPDSPDYWSGGNGSNSDPYGKGLVMEKSLPSGVHFAEEGGPAPTGGGSDDQAASGTWVSKVIFLPDGSAKNDYKLTFNIKGARTTTLQLRALTGIASVSVANH